MLVRARMLICVVSSVLSVLLVMLKMVSAFVTTMKRFELWIFVNRED